MPGGAGTMTGMAAAEPGRLAGPSPPDHHRRDPVTTAHLTGGKPASVTKARPPRHVPEDAGRYGDNTSLRHQRPRRPARLCADPAVRARDGSRLITTTG